MPTVRTCLWFDQEGEHAARHYCEVIDRAELGEILYPPEGTPNTVPGVPVTVNFRIGDQEFQLLNGGPSFPPSEYASISLECETQEEADRVWAALVADGGSEGECGWLKDRWGVNWQIVPVECRELLADPATSAAAFGAMMHMTRLDSAAMRAACGR